MIIKAVLLAKRQKTKRNQNIKSSNDNNKDNFKERRQNIFK